jgi:asparagine synthase (glutamine-hydrolysing)
VLFGRFSLTSFDRNTPASGAAPSRDGRWQLYWSGRLDNAGDFGVPAGDGGGGGAAAAVVEAVAARGLAALGDAVGDFALVLVDHVERIVWLARDGIGFRPLFYSRAGDALSVGLDARDVAADPVACYEPHAAEWLSGQVHVARDTLYAGVQRVRPGEALGFRREARDPVRRVLWQPPAARPVRNDRAGVADALVDEFRALAGRAIGASLAGGVSPSVQLSGGLDSTTVLMLSAAHLGRAPDAYSLVYPGMALTPDGEMLDESEFSAAAARFFAARRTPLEPLTLPAHAYLRVLAAHGDPPDSPIGDALHTFMGTRAVADGHRVMLTGYGGDFWMTGSLATVAALAARGRVLAARRFYLDARRSPVLDASPASVLAHLVTGLVPRVWRDAYRGVRPARAWPAWIAPDFARATSLADRLRPPDEAERGGDPEMRDVLRLFYSTADLVARESLYRSGADAGIEMRHPMMDRRLVSFLLTLPSALRYRDGATRVILRRAFGAALPPLIRDRTTKGDGGVAASYGLAHLLTPLAETPVARWQLVERGWVDATAFDAALAAAQWRDWQTRAPVPADDALWRAASLEHWLRRGSRA